MPVMQPTLRRWRCVPSQCLHSPIPMVIFSAGGLSQMDLAGGTVAVRRANGRVVTVAVTAMTFHRPVFVGDEVTCYAEIVKIGRTSMTLKIKAFARRGRTGEKIEVTEGLFTYVAVDAEGKSRPVHP